MKSQIIVTVTGKSGSGKTTLIEKLVKDYISEGKKVSVLKSMRHDFEVDRQGKDTFRYREAGADSALITNGKKFALMSDIAESETPLDLAVKYFPDSDIIIIEGFKEGNTPKIEVIGDSDETPLFHGDSGIVMIATEREIDTALPVYSRNDIAGIKACIEKIFIH